MSVRVPTPFRGTSWSRRRAWQSGELSRALVDTRRQLAHVELLQRERLHDARSAVLGLIGASQLLARPNAAGALDTTLLRSLVAEELTRLRDLLDTDATEQLVSFALADALSMIVRARRLDGMTIDTDWHDVRVLARPRATATVIDNLLRNAQRHAPGARVRITAHVVAHEVEIIVQDDGPGIPSSERAMVLRPGVRGSSARGSGSGLGLSSAATTMAAQAGSLRIGSSPGGGARLVLHLPAILPMHALAN